MTRISSGWIARGAAAAAAVAFLAAPAASQETGEKEREGHTGHDAHGAHAAHADRPAVAIPDGWEMRLDRPDQDAAGVSFVEMAPGWHITTGPAAILYRPEDAAGGSFRVEMDVHLFDPGERREAFGIFLGGSDLQGEGQAYSYFLIRRDGRFLIKRRLGAETPVVRDWAEHPAVVSWEERGEGQTAHNVLVVDVGESEVSFLVNGQEVARLPKADLDTDGVVGMRINHGLNLHVTRLDVDAGGG